MLTVVASIPGIKRQNMLKASKYGATGKSGPPNPDPYPRPINNTLRIAKFPEGPYTVIDTGTDQGWAGNGWKIIKRHGKSKTTGEGDRTYPVVDVLATLVDPTTRKDLAVLRMNQVMFRSDSRESLLPPDQMSWHGLSCDTTPIKFGGRQQILGGDFTLPLWWDGKTTFFTHKKTTKDHLQALRIWTLTGAVDYNPSAWLKPDTDSKLTRADRAYRVEIYAVHNKDSVDFLEDFAELSVTRRRYLWEPGDGHNWQPHQLAEWRERLGNVSEEVVKKTFLATTQLVPSVKHENEDNPKDHHVARFPMLKSRRLRETWYIDICEIELGTKAKDKEYALVCYGGKSKATIYYPLGKTNTSDVVLQYLWEFTRDIGMPDKICSDFASNLVQNAAYKRFMRLTLIQVAASEPDHQNQNLVERRWQDMKRHAETIATRRMVPQEQMHRLYQHLCDCFNHTATDSLAWRTPWEALDGDTPDISVFRFKFWEPVWYLMSNRKYPAKRYLRGRFVGIAWTTGDNMCYRIWTDEKDLISREIHRSVVLPRHPDEEFPRTLVKYTSDYFFPTPKLPKNSPEVVSANLEGGRKRIREQSKQPDEADKNNGGTRITPGPREGRSKRPGSGDHTTYTPGTGAHKNVDIAEGTIPESTDVGNLGPEEAEVRKRWLEMTEAEANRVLELYAPPTEGVDYANIKTILSHKTTTRDGVKTITFRVKYRSGEVIQCDLDDLKLDAPYSLATYLRQKKIMSPTLREWSQRTLGTLDTSLYRTRLIEPNTSIRRRHAHDASATVVTLTRCNSTFSSRRRVKTNSKPGRNKRRPHHSSGCEVKYGVKIPRTVGEAIALDKLNGDDLWHQAIKKEIGALMEMQTFNILGPDESKSFKRDGFQYARLMMIFDVKQDLRRKARLVLGGHMIDASGHDTYATNMKGISARILMLIASANELRVLTGDIGNAYLYASTNEKIFCRLGEEFSIAGHGATGRIAVLEKALYGTKSAANRWHAHLADTLRCMGFTTSRYDADIWYQARSDGSGYDYIGTHTDDLMIVAKNPEGYFEVLQEKYTIKKIGPPTFHLGCDYVRGPDGRWSIGTETYVKETMERVKTMLGRKDLGKDDTPISPTFHPELDNSQLLDVDQHRLYQQLVGIAQWLITCGRLDLCYAISSLSRFSSAPRIKHLNALERVFKYINKNRALAIKINPENYILPKHDIMYEGADWTEQYPGAIEEMDEKFPTPLGKELSTTIYFDSDHAHDQKTRRSITGMIAFIGSTPVTWASKRQGAIATSTYTAELCAGRTAAEEAISIRYMLRSLGVPVTTRTLLLGDNLGSLQSTSNPGSECHKKHSMVNYHCVRECCASGIIQLAKVDTKLNLSDGFTKAIEKSIYLDHRRCHFAA